MKRISSLLIVFCSFLPIILIGQTKPNYVGEWYQRSSQGRSVVNANVFSRDRSDYGRTKRYRLKANLNQLHSILNTKPVLLNLPVPYGGKTYTLKLVKVDLTSEAFNISTNQGNANHDTGVQYRGIVDNNPAHIASANITQNDNSIFFSTAEGNFVVTKEGNDYIVYNEQEVAAPGVIFCQTPDVTFQVAPQRSLVSGVGCKTVNVYFECDYAFYQAKGSTVAAVTDYVMGFFNQVATLYANENVGIQVSEIFTWTTPDPYAALTTPSAIMNSFRTTRGTNFNGNLAHFLTTRNVGGGIAYVDVICNKAYAYGVSRIYTTYSNFPTYSWTVNVVTHELGHNLGSPHTHSCSWAGGPIDNCLTQEGTCTPGPTPPVGGGTIMSYCHTTSIGINFNNGFGPQPGNLIRSKVLAATCLPAGTGTSPPATLSATNITTSSATLNWAPATGATNYTAQYKLASASMWTPAGSTPTTSLNITGLTAGSNYVWSVKADCSAFSANASFTTTGSAGCAAPAQLTSTNIIQTGATLNWGAVTGATGYTVQYKTSAASTWATANATTNSHVISGLTGGTTYVWQVKASCSTYSAQASFVTTAAPPSGCSAPALLSTTNIIQTGATLSWGPVTGATGYTVQFKTSSSSLWSSVNATSTSVTISGLIAGTGYVWQVKANCSVYSAQTSFTTLASSSGCSAPSQLSTTNISQTTATVNWSAVSGATGYTVQYKTTPASTWTTKSATTNSASITGLAAGTNYVWQVKANCSAYSAQASFVTTTSTPTSGCAVPTNLGENSITNNAATLTWTGPTNALNYSIRYKLVGASGWTIRNNITGNSLRITGLFTKRNYQWLISAKCTNGTTSSLSAPKYFTTL